MSNSMDLDAEPVKRVYTILSTRPSSSPLLSTPVQHEDRLLDHLHSCLPQTHNSALSAEERIVWKSCGLPHYSCCSSCSNDGS